MVSTRTRQYETLRSNMAWGGDEAWRHIRPVHRSSWILSRPPADRKLWDSDFDPDVPIRVYIYIYPVHFVSARWTPPETRPTFHRSLVQLARSLPLSPGGWRQMLRFIEFRWIVARNRITRPCIVISQWQGKERFGSRSGERIRRFWRRVGKYEFLCVIFVTMLFTMLHTSRISKEILFYRYKMENWLIKRSTREVRIQIGLLRKIFICSFLLRYRSCLTVKSLKEKNNFIPDTQFFLFFFLYINLFRSKYTHKKKRKGRRKIRI